MNRSNFLRRIPEYLILAVLAALILTSFKPLPISAHPLLLSELLKGSDRGYIIPGSELKPFKEFLPARGTISFVTDQDFSVNQAEEKLLYDAQNFLAPLLINPDPVETVAIIYCSTSENSEARLAQFSYEWIKNMGSGKGVARKIK